MLNHVPHHFLFLFLMFLVISSAVVQFFPDVFIAVERFGTRLAERKRLCIILLATTAVVFRVILLLVVPIPHPEIHDEFSYLLAGDTFAHGRLTNPPHPMAAYFDTFHVIQNPTYMSIYPPAQGVALGLGQLLGHPWIGVLLSVSVMTGIILWALQAWFPARWALLGGIFVLLQTAISGYWINSYWGGAVAATGGALVFGALPRIIRSCRPRDAIILGLGASILANSRPFEGLIFCLPAFAVHVVWIFGRHRPPLHRMILHIVLPFCAVIALCVCFMGYYNFRLTGHPSLFAYVLNVRSHFAIPQLAWEKSTTPFHFKNPQFEAYYNHWWPAMAWPKGRPNNISHLALAFGLDSWRFTFFYLYPGFLIAILAAPWILRDRRMRFPIAQLLCCFAGFLLVAWFQAHYAAALTATTFALVVQGFRHIRHCHIFKRPQGVYLTQALVVTALLLSPFHNHDPLPPMAYRQEIEAELASQPGKALVVVHYSSHHDPSQEWVFNNADIDHEQAVWARDIPGVSLQPLFAYFRDRRIWFVDPDENPPKISPYEPSKH